MNVALWIFGLFLVFGGFYQDDDFQRQYAEYKATGHGMFSYKQLPSHFQELQEYISELGKDSTLLQSVSSMLKVVNDTTIPAQEVLWEFGSKVYLCVSYAVRECIDNYYRFFKEYGPEISTDFSDCCENALSVTMETINRLAFKMKLGFYKCGYLMLRIFYAVLNEGPDGYETFPKGLKGFVFTLKTYIIQICRKLDFSETDGIVWLSSLLILYTAYLLLDNNVNAMDDNYKTLLKKLQVDCQERLKNFEILSNEQAGGHSMGSSNSLVDAQLSQIVALVSQN